MNTADKLAEAIELAEDAMAYVPEYFANKHGMLRRMAALKEVAAHDAEQAANAVPAGFVLVPIDVLEDASTALGNCATACRKLWR